MPEFRFIITQRLYNNILNGKLKKVVTDRVTDEEEDGYIVELRSFVNNRVRYYTTQKALEVAKNEYQIN